MFLALPHLGCLAALALIAHVLYPELGQRAQTIYATAVAAGCTWFFVSTGWLSYNDSWTILGLVAAAFVRSRLVLGAAVLLGPWIDERLLLLLPVCLALRSYVVYEAGAFRPLLIDAGIAAATAAPYLAIRLFAYLGGSDPVTGSYVQDAAKEVTLLWHLILGAWMGLRGLWVYVAAFCFLACRRPPSVWNASVLAGMLVTFLVMLFVAADIGRSVSALMPVGLAGIVLFARHAPDLCRRSLLWVLIPNLLLPASHVLSERTLPVRYLYYELERWSAPPFYLTPEYYNREGLALLQQGDAERAWEEFETALRLDPNYVAARGNKAMILVARRQYEAAIQELDAVVASGMNLPDALRLRGNCFEALQQHANAFDDYQRALSLAPADWTSRSDVQQRLQRLRSRP
jgi:hypothetical protein